ncbi:MAG: DUF1761 family protein, partial [Planctomycetales bacterium]|nr:DUF1761 family protein [Planctomycetales bacterium]
MDSVSVVVAAIAGFAFGAVWYMALAKPWMAAAGVEIGEDGRPANGGNPAPYIIGFVGSLLVAGMMRHLFAISGIDSAGAGLIAGLGLGLFIAAPWIVTNYAFAGRPKVL